MATVITATGKTGVSYRVRTRDAQKRSTTETFRTKAEAEWFARLVEDVGGPTAIRLRIERDGAGADELVPTLGEWLPRHVASLTGVTERYRLRVAREAELYWLDELGNIPLNALTREHVGKIVNGLESRGLSPSTIKTVVVGLGSVLNAAIFAGYMTRNPCKGLRLPRAVDEHPARFLTVPQAARLLANLPERERPLAAMLFGSGLRWSEATALTVADVHLASKPGELHTVSVSKAWKTEPGKSPVIGPPKSARSVRTAVLSDHAAGLVRPLLEGRAPGALVFTGPRGGAVGVGDWRSRKWYPACIAAGLATREDGEGYVGPRIHDARHSHAGWLLTAGADLVMVSDQLGHQSILTTREVYGHLLPESRNRLAEALRAAMASGMASTSAGELAPGGDH